MATPTFGPGPSPGAIITTADIVQLRAAPVVAEPLAASLFDFVGGMTSARSGVRYQGVDFSLGNGAT